MDSKFRFRMQFNLLCNKYYHFLEGSNNQVGIQLHFEILSSKDILVSNFDNQTLALLLLQNFDLHMDSKSNW